MSVYYGERQCQGKKKSGQSCSNHAYYLLKGQYVCGVHSLKYKDERQILMQNPDKKKIIQNELSSRTSEIENLAKEHQLKDIKGDVVCYKMKMMKPVEYKKGFLNVFPNYNHGNR